MDERFAEACIAAQDRCLAAARRLRAANEELNDAEREHRLAREALEAAEALYYKQPVSASEMQV